jgi:hypothetical protein
MMRRIDSGWAPSAGALGAGSAGGSAGGVCAAAGAMEVARAKPATSAVSLVFISISFVAGEPLHHARSYRRRCRGTGIGDDMLDQVTRSIHPPLTSIFLADFVASALLGKLTFRTPFLKSAPILAASTPGGNLMDRWNAP